MRCSGCCDPIAYLAEFPATELSKTALSEVQIAHETFIATFIALLELHQRGAAAAAQCRARDDLGVPAHAVAAGRLQLPASADLFDLWR